MKLGFASAIKAECSLVHDEPSVVLILAIITPDTWANPTAEAVLAALQRQLVVTSNVHGNMNECTFSEDMIIDHPGPTVVALEWKGVDPGKFE